jgi:hypothetical protein
MWRGMRVWRRGGYEWTVEGTRAGPRDTRRLDVGSECERGSEGRKIGVKLIKKGREVEDEEGLFKWGVCVLHVGAPAGGGRRRVTAGDIGVIKLKNGRGNEQ